MNEEQRKRLLAAAPGENMIFKDRSAFTDSEVKSAHIIAGNIAPGRLALCESLRFMQLDSAGAGDFTAPGVLPKGALLACATGTYGLAISEHMLGCLLAMQKKLYLYHNNQKERLWRKEGHVDSVYGSRVLILGAGDIGCAFAERVKALGAYTVGIRRTPSEKPQCLDELYTMDAIDRLLPEADVIAMSLPGTPATRHVLSRERLLLIKEGAYIINVGRGPAIDTDALTELASRFKGVSLDVTDPEPLPPDHPLWSKENVYITPHISGGYTLPATLDRIVTLAAVNIKSFLAGGPIKSLVDMDTGYRAR